MNYGQVYRTFYEAWNNEDWPHGMAFRAILMVGGKEVYYGRRRPTPDEAFADLKEHAPEHGITDLRKWSGKI